jgi:hypothetical protein
VVCTTIKGEGVTKTENGKEEWYLFGLCKGIEFNSIVAWNEVPTSTSSFGFARGIATLPAVPLTEYFLPIVLLATAPGFNPTLLSYLLEFPLRWLHELYPILLRLPGLLPLGGTLPLGGQLELDVLGV